MPHVRQAELDRLRAADRACQGFTLAELRAMEPGELAYSAACARLAYNDWRGRGAPPIQHMVHRAFHAFGALGEVANAPHVLELTWDSADMGSNNNYVSPRESPVVAAVQLAHEAAPRCRRLLVTVTED